MALSYVASLIEATQAAFTALGLGTAIGLGLAGVVVAVEFLTRGQRPRRPAGRRAPHGRETEGRA